MVGSDGKSGRMAEAPVKFPDTFFENLIDNMFDGVYYVDPTRKILYWNQGAERITPDELAMLTGTFPYEIMLGFTARVARAFDGM